MKVGDIALQRGLLRVAVRSAGPVRQFLWDLREVRFVPAGQKPGAWGK
ncbi:MAG: hypothetical protein AAF517_16490 [Planctomycetota bacterium]